MRIFSSVFFFGFIGYFLLRVGWGVIVRFVFLWVRGRFPRMRYDRLMRLTWKRFLPVRIRYLFFSLFVRWIV